MNKNKRKWCLAVVLVCCLAPTTFAAWGQGKGRDRDHGCDPRRDRQCQQQVPEGGSTAIYLLGAGLTCFGAMFLRSKALKPVQA
jgi:hypothetical protein